MKKPTAPRDRVNRDALRAAIREELPLVLAALLAPKPAIYSTRRGHGIPGESEESSKAKIKDCPYAIPRGRWLVVDPDLYATWEKSRQPKPATSVAPAPSSWSPAAALAEAGLRGTR